MSRTGTRRLARLAALALGCAVGLCVIELGLRVFGYRGAGERTTRVFDPRYGEVKPDSWIFDFAIDPKKHRAIDLRGQLVPLEKTPGERRVLFLGDSATEGAFVTLAESYPLRWKALLDQRRPGNHVRAINAGVWGMTTIDEYHLLHDKLLPLRPDVVVLGLFMANDINFNLGHGQRRRVSGTPKLIDTLRAHSALAHVLYLRALELNQRYRFVNAGSWSEHLVPTRIGLVDRYGLHMLSYPAGELALYMKHPSALEDEAFATLADALAELQALGRERGFLLRVLLIPTPSSVAGRLAILAHPEILRELRAQGVAISPDDLDFMLPTRRVLAICARLELPCVDPMREFRALGLSAFFAHDEHPTAAGHEALARALLAQDPT